MSDEEKEAIEYWKGYISLLEYNMQIASNYYAQILLNLIERQSKEIEELKEECCCMTSCERKDKETIFLKQKIKDKIEEIKNKKDNLVCYETRTKMINKIGAIQLLQELLEE